MPVSLEKPPIQLQAQNPAEFLDVMAQPDVYMTPNELSVPHDEVAAIGGLAAEHALSAEMATSVEIDTGSGEVPIGDELTHELEHFVGSSQLPSVELASANTKNPLDIALWSGEELDVTKPEIVTLAQNTYVEQAARALQEKAWWNGLDTVVDLPDNQALRLSARHELQFNVEGPLSDQKLEVFEVGASRIDPAELSVVVDALKLVDQHTGGLLTLDEYRKPVVILNEGSIAMKQGERHTHGTAFEGKTPMGLHTTKATIIDIKQIRQRAAEFGLDAQALTTTTVIHEILGHQLDYAMTETGRPAFEQFFEYSEEMTTGESFNVHQTVASKDETVQSEPVREYGKASAAEDFATSVEAAMHDVLPQDVAVKGTAYEVSQDAYRAAIVTDVMNAAASKAADYGGVRRYGVPGFVGSEIKYTYGPDGALQTEQVRTMTISTVDGQVAAQDEFAKIARSYVPLPSIAVRKQEVFM